MEGLLRSEAAAAAKAAKAAAAAAGGEAAAGAGDAVPSEGVTADGKGAVAAGAVGKGKGKKGKAKRQDAASSSSVTKRNLPVMNEAIRVLFRVAAMRTHSSAVDRNLESDIGSDRELKAKAGLRCALDVMKRYRLRFTVPLADVLIDECLRIGDLAGVKFVVRPGRCPPPAHTHARPCSRTSFVAGAKDVGEPAVCAYEHVQHALAPVRGRRRR